MIEGGEGANGKRVGERGGIYREFVVRIDIVVVEEE